jgi:hypothetical protein
MIYHVRYLWCTFSNTMKFQVICLWAFTKLIHDTSTGNRSKQWLDQEISLNNHVLLWSKLFKTKTQVYQTTMFQVRYLRCTYRKLFFLINIMSLSVPNFLYPKFSKTANKCGNTNLCGQYDSKTTSSRYLQLNLQIIYNAVLHDRAKCKLPTT